MKNIRKFGIVAVILCFVIDQATKWIILNHVMIPPRAIPVTPFFNLTYTWNPGITFGMLHADSFYGTLMLIALAVALSVFLAYCLWTAVNRTQAIGFGMALGGAIGNITDRIIHGAVFDFIDLHAMGHHWYVFNGADAFIDIGIGLAIISQFIKPQMIDWKE
jgi:signal peptidase II